MPNNQGITSNDISRLTLAINKLRQSLDSLAASSQAANKNLVAIHSLIKEMNDGDG